MISGLGFMIWKLSSMPKVDTLITILKTAKVSWLSIKVGEGAFPYNQVGGNDKVLRDEYIAPLQAAGIHVGGWFYCYPKEIGAQTGLMAERVQKLGIEHILLDVEKEWKGEPGMSIDRLLYIDVNKKLPVGLCSYRYPSLHSEINWTRFFKNDQLNLNAPQVYWIGSHNPKEQLERCYREYAKYDSADTQFVPIGATFAQGTPGKASYWEPSESDLEEFVLTCKEKRWAYGFYSLDWLLAHERYNWLSVISGAEVEPPGPPPAQLPKAVLTKTTANPWTSANASAATDAGTINQGYSFRVLGPKVNGYWPVEMWLHETTVKEA